MNEIQSVGFDFGARTITAGPTSKRPSAEPALLADDDADPFDLCYRREQHEILGRALSHLRERERQIITLYYQQELTMKQIADRYERGRITRLATPFRGSGAVEGERGFPPASASCRNLRNRPPFEGGRRRGLNR